MALVKYCGPQKEFKLERRERESVFGLGKMEAADSDTIDFLISMNPPGLSKDEALGKGLHFFEVAGEGVAVSDVPKAGVSSGKQSERKVG